MQSVLQYRRFGQTARRQYERDRKRAEALERGNAEDESTDVEETEHRKSSVEDAGSPDSRDPEKAEQPGAYPEKDEDGHQGRDLERGQTQDTMRSVHSFGTRLGHALTGIEVRQLSKELTKTGTRRGGKGKGVGNENQKGAEGETVFVVGYECENDCMNPHKWSLMTRISATILIASIGFIVGFASSVDSAALTQASKEFGVSEVAESLATGLFLVGFGFGALFAGPISETVGRNPVYIVTLAVYMIWISTSFSPHPGY